MDNIYNYRFVAADSLLKSYTKTHKADNWYHLISCNYYWWMIVTGEESKTVLTNFDFHISSIITSLAKIPASKMTNEQLYLVANAYAFKSRLALYKTSYLQAASNLNNSLEYIKASLKKETVYEPFYITGGLYNYFVDFAAKRYPLTRPYLSFMPSGSIAEGIRMLNHLTESEDWVLENEGHYFLCKVYQEAEKNYVIAEKHAAWMVRKYPRNIAFIYNYFEVLLKQGKKEEAMKQLVNINLFSKMDSGLTEKQRGFYITQAQKELKEYYAGTTKEK